MTKANNTIQFFAYALVEDTFVNESTLYDDYYKSKKKLKLKIKYFQKPIPTKDIAFKLDLVENKNKAANYFKSEYKKISKEDFVRIRRIISLIDYYPEYLDIFSMSIKEFIMKTISSLYNMLKSIGNRKQIEIKKFISILRKILSEYGVNKSFEDLETFYAHNVYELGFRHVPSRDPDKFVALYTPTGEKRNFAYLSFE